MLAKFVDIARKRALEQIAKGFKGPYALERLAKALEEQARREYEAARAPLTLQPVCNGPHTIALGKQIEVGILEVVPRATPQHRLHKRECASVAQPGAVPRRCLPALF